MNYVELLAVEVFLILAISQVSSSRNITETQSLFQFQFTQPETNLFHAVHIIVVAQCSGGKLIRLHWKVRDDDLFQDALEVLQAASCQTREERQENDGLALQNNTDLRVHCW